MGLRTAGDYRREKQRQRQHADCRLGLRECEEYRREHDDRPAKGNAAHPRHEQADEDEKHHDGAGLVLMREYAAPASGMFGLEEVRRLVNGKLRHEEDAEIAGGQHDEHQRAIRSLK